MLCDKGVNCFLKVFKNAVLVGDEGQGLKLNIKHFFASTALSWTLKTIPLRCFSLRVNKIMRCIQDMKMEMGQSHSLAYFASFSELC